MDFSKRGQAILFLDRNRFDYYDGASGRIASFPFDPTVINALEVLNAANLEMQIQSFIEQGGLAPASIVIVLSPNVLFEKDLTGLAPEQQEAETQLFLDNIPFDTVITKLTTFPQGVRISSTNKLLCDALKAAFEKKGFLVDAVAPYESLGQELFQIAGLDEQNAPVILKMYDALKNNSFPVAAIVHEKTAKAGTTKNASDKKAPPKWRPFALAAVFVVLIIILVFVYLNQK